MPIVFRNKLDPDNIQPSTTDPIAAARRPVQGNWVDYAGPEGGIPTYTTQHGSTLTSSSSAATINAALVAAPNDSFVKLGAGTFSLTAQIVINRSRAVLRGTIDGNGVPTTILNFTAGSGGGNGHGLVEINSSNIDLSSSGSMTTINIVGVPARGTTTVTLASTPTALQANQLMFISAIAGLAAGEWSNLFQTRPLTQIVRVVSKSGNDVTFTPAVNSDYLSGTVQVHYSSIGDSPKLSGVEHLKITQSGSAGGHHFGFLFADSCWAYNVWSSDIDNGAYHFWPDGAYRCAIKHCDVSHCLDPSSSNSTYAINVARTSQLLIEDCHFHDFPNVMPMFGMNGSAFAYNYYHDATYFPSDWLSQGVFFHGSHNAYNLFEGNWQPDHHNDAFGETTSRNNVWFRNRILGWDENTVQGVPKTDNTKPFFFDTVNVNATIVGNVLGHTGTATVYSDTNEFSNDCIYALPSTPTGLQRTQNYNTVDSGIHASEALGAGEAIVTSYLYNSKPSWYPSTLPWPPIDPTNFSQSNNVENLPAGYRAVHGSDAS